MDQTPYYDRYDKYELYKATFQCPPKEIDFISSVATGNLLREDFCGTAELLAEWLHRSANHNGIGVDTDQHVLNRAKEKLKDFGSRIDLICANAVDRSTPGVNIICAPNSSIFLLRRRTTLKNYLARCYKDLANEGVMIVDVFGGPDCYGTGEDYMRNGNWACVWRQQCFDPSTNEFTAVIDFVEDGGETISNAFIYRMRLWSPAELVDACYEVGFSDCTVSIAANRYEIASAAVSARYAEQLNEWEAYVVAYKL